MQFCFIWSLYTEMRLSNKCIFYQINAFLQLAIHTVILTLVCMEHVCPLQVDTRARATLDTPARTVIQVSTSGGLKQILRSMLLNCCIQETPE